jgi:hypothetical protein
MVQVAVDQVVEVAVVLHRLVAAVRSMNVAVAVLVALGLRAFLFGFHVSSWASV